MVSMPLMDVELLNYLSSISTFVDFWHNPTHPPPSVWIYLRMTRKNSLPILNGLWFTVANTFCCVFFLCLWLLYANVRNCISVILFICLLLSFHMLPYCLNWHLACKKDFYTSSLCWSGERRFLFFFLIFVLYRSYVWICLWNIVLLVMP